MVQAYKFAMKLCSDQFPHLAKMRTFVVIALAVVLGLAYGRPEDKKDDKYYTTKYDNVDLDEIIKSDRLVQNYCNCLLSDSSVGCSPDGNELRELLPDALHNACVKCSDKHKAGAKKMIHFLIEQKRVECWDKLEKKYDPEGTYRKKYEEDAKKEGIKL